MPENAWLIPALPLLAWILTWAVGPKLGERASFFGIAALGLAFLLSLQNLGAVWGGARHSVSLPWLEMGEARFSMGFQVGPLEAVMLFMVTLVSWMVFIFSRGYMHGDDRFNRFYANICLFVGAMLTLVIADNFILFFAAWEIMGLCSYLLIGHWFRELENARAAMKAFLVTRVGDVGLMLGMFLLYAATGSLRFEEVFARLEGVSPALLTFAAVMVFVGVAGKSAQVPLHIWLPDAMAGPTPVSALIHAATMVAAGVYLVARVYPLFEAAPGAMEFAAFVGALTALVGALLATVQTDIKKVIAYSTISQLGLMILGLGVGGLAVGIFHLNTHSFFKALLFLAAGSVIHAAHTQDLHRMGGLFRKLPLTGVTFLAGTLALAGLPPLAGFFSKDEILLEAFHASGLLFWMAVAASFLTAYYMMRAVFLAFFGEPRDERVYAHAHESPPVMTVPLLVLSAFAVFGGLAGAPFLGHPFQSFLEPHGEAAREGAGLVQAVAVSVALGGMALAWLIYGAGVVDRRALIRTLYPLYFILKQKLFFDHLALGIARAGLWLRDLCAGMDRYLVDGIAHGLAGLSWAVGAGVRRLGAGSAQGYALVMFAGLALALVVYLRVAGG